MSEKPASAVNAAQIEYWNAAAGETWAQYQEQLDRQIAPLGLEALRTLAPAKGEAVIDIGCGCGQTTIDLASRVGNEGSAVGCVIAALMLDVAGHRPGWGPGTRPQFREVDAQRSDIGHAIFD